MTIGSHEKLPQTVSSVRYYQYTVCPKKRRKPSLSSEILDNVPEILVLHQFFHVAMVFFCGKLSWKIWDYGRRQQF